eukprot:3815052-Rhodomonas_salina.3
MPKFFCPPPPSNSAPVASQLAGGERRHRDATRCRFASIHGYSVSNFGHKSAVYGLDAPIYGDCTVAIGNSQ